MELKLGRIGWYPACPADTSKGKESNEAAAEFQLRRRQRSPDTVEVPSFIL